MSARLFEIRLDGSGAAAAAQNAELRSAAHAEPPYRQPAEHGIRRYCCGCARETEHVLCGDGDRASIPAIRWPAVTPASGTTICVDCGQWRATASRPTAAHEGPLESATENEGMPPLRDPSGLRRRQPARTMKKAIATY
jgi:hypothetical protein